MKIIERPLGHIYVVLDDDSINATPRDIVPVSYTKGKLSASVVFPVGVAIHPNGTITAGGADTIKPALGANIFTAVLGRTGPDQRPLSAAERMVIQGAQIVMENGYGEQSDLYNPASGMTDLAWLMENVYINIAINTAPWFSGSLVDLPCGFGAGHDYGTTLDSAPASGTSNKGRSAMLSERYIDQHTDIVATLDFGNRSWAVGAGDHTLVGDCLIRVELLGVIFTV